MADKTILGSHYFQLLSEDGKPFVSFSSEGVECATFEPDTFTNTSEYCVVKNPSDYYPTYRRFIEEYCWDREDDWVENDPPIKDRVYKIIDCAHHSMDNKQIYIIGEDGIEKFEKYTGLSGDVTIGVDEALCCDNDISIATKYERYVMGKWDFPTIEKGEMEMRNEVLELYAKRERERIENTFRAMKEEEYNNLEAVKRYNELINTFKASLAELVDEYKNEEPKIFIQTVYEDHFGYEINPYLERQISEKFQKDFEAEMRELDERIEEIKAVLSLSNDVEYQKNVLVEYGILNKKGVMVNE